MRKSAVEMSVGLIIISVSALMLVAPVNADVAQVTDYRVPGMVDQINAVVDVVNGVVDGSNKIDGEIIANDTIDDDSIDFSDVTLSDITPDVITVAGSGVSAVSTNKAVTNVLVTVGAELDGEYIANDTIDDDSIDFSDVTLSDITPDTLNVPAGGVVAISTNGASTNVLITVDAQVDGQHLKNDSVGKAAVGVISQSDANETTVASIYTPDFIGQVLVGGAGSGTNAIWVAKGLTTNDWLKLTIATE